MLLEKYGIMNGDLDEDTKAAVQECNTSRKTILGGTAGNDILAKCETDIGDGSLDAANQTELADICDKITADILVTEDVAKTKALDMYKKLFNCTSTNEQELLNNSTILPLLQAIRTNMPDLKTKIQSGKMTAADIKAMKQFMNNYFAMKKELEIATNIYTLIKKEDGSARLRFGEFFMDSFGNMAKGFELLFQ